MNESINLHQFQEQDFTGLFNESSKEDLVKAIIAGDITGRDTTDLSLTGEPLKTESLETTLKLLEFRQKDIKLWNAIPKKTAYNTVEEYLQQTSYGTDRGGFYNEGEPSNIEDSAFKRKAETVKYIQVTKQVTLQVQTVRSYVDPMRKAAEDAVMWITRRVNSALTKADSKLVPQQFNSLYAQHARIGVGDQYDYATLDAWQDSSVVYDMRGGSVTQDDLVKIAEQLDANYANVDTLFGPPSVTRGIAQDHFQSQRIMMGAAAYTGTIGTIPQAIDTDHGKIGLNNDKFMKRTPYRVIDGTGTSPSAPNGIATPSVQVVSDAAGSRFLSTDLTPGGSLGTVFYAISAVNKFGESPLIPAANTVKQTLGEGSSVELNWADGGGAFPATAYRVYRSKVTDAVNATTGAVKFYPLFDISVAEKAAGYDGGAAGLVRDRGRFLPDTEDAFVTEMSEDILSFKSLAPVSKLDLAVTAPSRQFICYLWGTPLLYANTKLVRIINVGPYVR